MICVFFIGFLVLILYVYLRVKWLKEKEEDVLWVILVYNKWVIYLIVVSILNK